MDSKMPFDSAKRTRNPEQLPKGIKRHELGYLVRYQTITGTYKHKLVRSMDAAIAFHADPLAEDEESDGNEPDACVSAQVVLLCV